MGPARFGELHEPVKTATGAVQYGVFCLRFMRMLASPGGPAADTGPMKATAAAIARRFSLHAAGRTFATKLANAAPFLFTFINCPWVYPTSNESERMLRRGVIARKIRFRIAGLEGSKVFSNIMTFVLTRRKRGLNVSDMLLKVSSGT